MDIEFSSLTELYDRIKPALNSKRKELERENLGYIQIEDIWNFLKERKWFQSRNLSLAEMVDDILNCHNYEIDMYVKEKLRVQERTATFNDLDNLL